MDNSFMNNTPENSDYMNYTPENSEFMNEERMNTQRINEPYIIGGILNDAFVTINRGRIENITNDNRNLLITVAYTRNQGRNQMDESLRLVINNRTLVFDEFGNALPPAELTRDMIINAIVSSSMTRSIPPQATAYAIRVIRRPVSDNVITGRIIDIDRDSRMFTTITGNNPRSIVRFSVPTNTPIFDMQGRPMGFVRLFPGLRVQVRHANFMTASIPPQTTAREIRVIG